LEPAFNDNPDVGTVGIYEKYTRLTFVCYLRGKISKCPDHKDLSEHDLAHLTKSGHSKIQHSKLKKIYYIIKWIKHNSELLMKNREHGP